MSEWKTYKISEVYEGLYDGPHATPPDSDTGAIFLGISNITPGGRLDFSDIKHISEYDLPKWTKRVVPTDGDIVFSYEATLNLYAMIPKGFWGCLGRRMALIRPNNSKAYGQFLYYYFFSPQWRATIQNNTVVGATVDRIPIARFPDFPVTIPDLETQHRIADALTAYDSLIETNQRQIKLLEEAAKRLYREWFVDLRYPGHENVPVVDGVPEGWRKCILGDLFEVVRGKSYSSAEISGNNGMLMVNLSNIRSFGGYNRQQEKVFNGKYKQEQMVRAHDLIMGVTDMTQEKRTVGRVALIPDLHSEAIISMDLIKLIPKDGSTLFFYAFLLWGNYSEIASRFSNGTNVLHLRPEVLNMIDALLPSNHLQDLFVSSFSKIVKRIDALQDEIILASEARDRLLPKLMSGEIAV